MKPSPDKTSVAPLGRVELLGEVPADHRPGLDIWPSDHAGLAAELRFFTGGAE